MCATKTDGLIGFYARAVRPTANQSARNQGGQVYRPGCAKVDVVGEIEEVIMGYIVRHEQIKGMICTAKHDKRLLV